MKKLFCTLAALCGLLALGCPDPGKSSPPVVDLAAELTGLNADGSATATTTKLSLTFDQDIPGLAAADLTLQPGDTGAVKGALTKTGTGTYELALSGITSSGTVMLSVYKKGYIMAGSPKQAPIYYGSGKLAGAKHHRYRHRNQLYPERGRPRLQPNSQPFCNGNRYKRYCAL